MNLSSFKPKIAVGVLVSAVILSSCKEQFLTETPTTGLSQQSARAAAVTEHPGRLMASNCFQCHGTNGYGMEHLAGMKVNELIGEMNEMKSKNVGADIMNVHAQAYTTDEIKLIADFFSKQ